MSGAKIYKVNNRLADSVDVRFGLSVDMALNRAENAVIAGSGDMRKSIADWVKEVSAIAIQDAPDRDRVMWLANGILGVAGSCGMITLSRCAGLFARSLDLMGEEWRQDVALVYAKTMARLLEGADRSDDEKTVLSSLEAMNQRLEKPDALEPARSA